MGQEGVQIDGRVVSVHADFSGFGVALLHPPEGEHHRRINSNTLFAVGVDQPGNEDFRLGCFSQPVLVFGIDFRV